MRAVASVCAATVAACALCLASLLASYTFVIAPLFSPADTRRREEQPPVKHR